MYEPRTYRQSFNNKRFNSFKVVFKETDLWIGIDQKSFCPEIKEAAFSKVVELREELENYIKIFPEFKSSLKPVSVKSTAPDSVKQMAAASQKAGIGPMAAVAGLFAEEVGRTIATRFSLKEVVVENGGDIFAQLKEPLTLSVYAGNSPLSEKVAVVIPAEQTPLGICTSAGKVGPSLSFGNAHAVMVVAKNTALADTFATAFGNQLKKVDDLNNVINASEKFPEIISLVAIIDDKIAIRGQLEVKFLK